LTENGARVAEVKASGTLQRFNPAAFGSPLPGSINGAFDASGRAGANWRGALNLALQPSTLASAPLWGHARLAADRQHVSNADVDVHLGPNVIAASGASTPASLARSAPISLARCVAMARWPGRWRCRR
jgi:translocation and assembly module TamB